MIYINNINEIEAIIRNELITQSELDSKFVKNSLSLYGSQLNNTNDNSIFTTLEPDQSLILFELYAIDSDFNMTETDDDDKIHVYSHYRIHIIIYGDNCRNLSNILISRFQTEFVRQKLFDEGLCLDSISYPQGIQEYINNVMWLRSDFDINISFEMKINQITKFEDFENLSQIQIIKED